MFFIRGFLVFGLFFIQVSGFILSSHAWAQGGSLTDSLADSADSKEPSITILAYGDSLIAGYGLKSGQDLPSQLEKVLRQTFAKANVINAGVSGETTAGGLARLQWTLSGSDKKPDIVLLSLGANDMLRALPPENAYQNLDKMIVEFKSRDIQVVLAGMIAAANLGDDYVTQFNGIYTRLKDKHQDIAFYPFLLKDVAGDVNLNQVDGIHPNEKGVSVIVSNIIPVLTDVIQNLLRDKIKAN